MKTAIKGLALASLLLTSSASFAGVTVTFVEPENYADLPFPAWERKEVLDELSEHFQNLAKTLPPGVDMKVEVLDIDLAGRIQHRRTNDLRVLRGGADWPAIKLRYSVTQGDSVIANGEDRLSDMQYLDGLRNHYSSGDPLRYEKQMIDDWFKEKILQKRPG